MRYWRLTQARCGLVRVLSQPVNAQQGVDYDIAGHIDMLLLSQALPFNDYDFYLCGPPQFTQMLYDGPARTEYFGSAYPC